MTNVGVSVPMRGKISSDLERDLHRFRGGVRWLAAISLIIRGLFPVPGGVYGGGGILISFLYDSQSVLLKYAICSEQLEDEECRIRFDKERLNEADLRSMPRGFSLPPR